MKYLLFLPFVLFTCCALLSGTKDTPPEDPAYAAICESFCLKHYPDTYGVQAKRIKLDLVRCVCLRPRGDTTTYINVQSYEKEEETRIEENAFEP